MSAKRKKSGAARRRHPTESAGVIIEHLPNGDRAVHSTLYLSSLGEYREHTEHAIDAAIFERIDELIVRERAAAELVAGDSLFTRIGVNASKQTVVSDAMTGAAVLYKTAIDQATTQKRDYHQDRCRKLSAFETAANRQRVAGKDAAVRKAINDAMCFGPTWDDQANGLPIKDVSERDMATYWRVLDRMKDSLPEARVMRSLKVVPLRELTRHATQVYRLATGRRPTVAVDRDDKRAVGEFVTFCDIIAHAATGQPLGRNGAESVRGYLLELSAIEKKLVCRRIALAIRAAARSADSRENQQPLTAHA